MSDTADQPATKKDVEDIADTINDLTTAIGHRFDEVDNRFNKIDNQFDVVNDRLDNLELGQCRIERKLNAVVDRQDEQSIEIKKLKQKVFKAA